MDFGRTENDFTNFDYSLPGDSESTLSVLKAKNSNEIQVNVGAAKWGNKFWVGKLYPPKTKDADFLTEYAKHFTTVELNTTFYKVPRVEDIKAWRNKVKNAPQFKFCPKFPQHITHIRRFRNTEEITNQFYESIDAFGENRGPMFLQLADNFTPKAFPDLKKYLELLPKEIPVHIELRAKDWYGIPNNKEAIFSLLKDLNIGTVISDTLGRRDCVHMELTTPHAFVRFVGTDFGQDNYKRIDEWVARFKNWREQGLQSVWFFIHSDDDKAVPDLCNYLINILNFQLGLKLEAPNLLNSNPLS